MATTRSLVCVGPQLRAGRQGARRGWAGRAVVAVLAMAGLVLAACAAEDPRGPTAMTRPQPHGGQYLGGTATGDTEAGAAFARWVLEQDPRREYLTDAVVRDERSLGVKVQPTVTKADSQDLLVSLAQGMARTFPGRPIEVIAFYQSGDKLAEGRYDPRVGQVAVEFAR
jgi:hypothetical protein